MQETHDPEIVHPLFNDTQGNTVTLATAIDRFGDFAIDNNADFETALAEDPVKVFNSIAVRL